jgi:hypothetical protein
MKKIKFINTERKRNYIQLENKVGNMITYKPYTICNLPDKFGTDEITNWFNYKGLTYIAE